MPIPTVIEMIIGVGAEVNQMPNRCKHSLRQLLCGQ